MKYSVYPDSEIKSIPLDAVKLHLVRPIGLRKLEKLLKKRKIKEISLSDSCNKRIGKKSRELLGKKRINLVKDNRSGRPLEIGLENVLKIAEFKKDYLSLRRIEELTGIPKSTVHYFLRHANRNKLRKGNQTIYLE